MGRGDRLSSWTEGVFGSEFRLRDFLFLSPFSLLQKGSSCANLAREKRGENMTGERTGT